MTPRIASSGGMLGSSPVNPDSRMASYSSSTIRSSLALKYRKNVLGEISAAAAIW